MEVQYQNEGFHRYMFLDSESIDPDSYEVNMLMQLRGNMLLPVKTYGENGNLRFQYDISGTTTLYQMAIESGLKMDCLQQLFTSIWKCCEEIEEYLLVAEALFIEPKMIFYHRGRQQFGFCYLPERMTEFGKSIIELTEFCMKYTDNQDKDAGLYIFGIFRNLQSGYVSREDIQKYTNSYNHPVQEDLYGHPEPNAERSDSRNSLLESSGSHSQNNLPISRSSHSRNRIPESGEIKCSSNTKKEKETKLTAAPHYLFYVYLFAGVVSTIAAGYFGIQYLFTDRVEKTLKLLVVCMIAAAIFVYSTVRTYRHKEDIQDSLELEGRKEAEHLPVMSDYENELYEQADTVMFQGISDTDLEEVLPVIPSETSVLSELSKEVEQGMQHSDRACRWILKSMTAGEPDIMLRILPGVLGRQKDADYVLNETEISRRHAMIYENDNVLYVEDLGSTNGTYIDDNKLNSGETRQLKENSVLRMGRQAYRLIERSNEYEKKKTENVDSDTAVCSSAASAFYAG